MLKAKNSLGIIFFPAFDWSISETHPERPERLLYTQDQLREEGVFDVEGIGEYKPDVAATQDVERVHFCFPDVPSVCTRSHFISAGGAMRAADLVLSGEHKKSFAMIRPPGHHAMKSVHGTRGFCNVNIEAVMVEHIRARHGKKRIAIVDTDCHHADGTQDIYWHDPDVLVISMHQDGRTIFPGSGFPNELGGPGARGRTVNIPLPPFTGDEGVLMVMDELVTPILEDFKPDIVINSAGQDNHFSDPITNMNVTARGYAELNKRLNPDIAVLEGGYAIQGALPYVNLGIVLAMSGLDFDHVREPEYDERKVAQSKQTGEYIEELCRQLPKIYFDPPEQKEETKIGQWHVRLKEIFYDVDQLHESQNERVYDCPHCPGTLRLETRSERIPLSLGIEIPFGGCEKCREVGYAEFEQAQLKGGFRYVQLIDRPSDEVHRVGF